MSYVDAYLNRDKDTINIVERINGKRIYKSYPTNYRFYYDDPQGSYKSIYGRALEKFETQTSKVFKKEK